MLADQICATGLPGAMLKPELLKPILRRVQTAQKFVLAPHFAAAADALSQNFGSLVRAFPFCRLPFPETWIEVAHMDRPEFAAAPVHAETFQARPSRVGWLCTATRDDLSAWRAHLFWHLNASPRAPEACSAAGLAIDFDMLRPLTTVTELGEAGSSLHDLDPRVFGKSTIEPNEGWANSNDSVRLAMVNHTHPALPDYGIPLGLLALGMNQAETIECYQLLAQLARADWSGEASYLLAVVGMMNARNATEMLPVGLTRLNRARQRRGEKPLLEHHIVKLHTRQERRVAHKLMQRGGGDMRAALRWHIVMGHWKVRKTGIFFWHPFYRGDRSKGEISKDYELT